MVRRGSTVRVRQRASRTPRKRANGVAYLGTLRRRGNDEGTFRDPSPFASGSAPDMLPPRLQGLLSWQARNDLARWCLTRPRATAAVAARAGRAARRRHRRGRERPRRLRDEHLGRRGKCGGARGPLTVARSWVAPKRAPAPGAPMPDVEITYSSIGDRRMSANASRIGTPPSKEQRRISAGTPSLSRRRSKDRSSTCSASATADYVR